jgi:indole-3-glycerol phosphate synthase
MTPDTLIERIVANKTDEVKAAEKRQPLSELKAMIKDAPEVRSFANALRRDFGLIAELKRKSPSVNDMRAENVAQAIEAYQASPIVNAISVLTENKYFGGSLDDLKNVRAKVTKPILRKDFIFRPYQVFEARAYGADAILLMACIQSNTKEELKRLFDIARELDMDVLFEAHDQLEINKIPVDAQICGLNSRKFKKPEAKDSLWSLPNIISKVYRRRDVRTDLSVFELVEKLQKTHKRAIKVAESGVDYSHIAKIREQGFDAALVGTSLLRAPEGVRAALARFESAILGQEVPDRVRNDVPVPA